MKKFHYIVFAVATGLLLVLFQTDLILEQTEAPLVSDLLNKTPTFDAEEPVVSTKHQLPQLKPETTPASVEYITITEAQIQQVERQQQEISAMMTEYDQVRSDPTQRALLRQDMQQKLEKYSQDVLPIVLAKSQQVN